MHGPTCIFWDDLTPFSRQRGVKGAPKKVQPGVTQMGITFFDLKGRPVSNILFQTMQGWDKDKAGVPPPPSRPPPP